MADVLCLDTEPETLQQLKASHNVLGVPFGYRDGVRYLHRAPQDFDLIVCDLRRPACFDRTKWGPYGGNDNYKCAIVPPDQVTWDYDLVSRNGKPPEKEYRHRLIYETQIEQMNGPSPFGPNDIRQAIAVGGVPAFIFLNREWVWRTGGYSFPDFVGLQWETGETNATRFSVLEPLVGVTTDWDPPLSVLNPVRCMLRSGPKIPARVQQKDSLHAEPIVVDRIGSILGQWVQYGNGGVWLLPATNDNAAVARNFADRPAVWQHRAQRDVTSQISSAAPQQRWDLFISHAFEDKTYADKLYEALRSRGVAVWYDKPILTMGDSLRQKIDEGLAASRFGVVVFSDAFFSKHKRWSQAELNALVGLQMADGRKRILPIWHGIDRAGVARYSPMLADLLASESRLGIERNVADILTAIDWTNGA
jgi:hypothetical protein